MSRRLALLVVCVAAAGLAGCGGGSNEKETANLEAFSSPDGNIGCIADNSLVRCDIASPDWTVPKNPKCQLDYGNGLTVAAKGPGEIVCAGDTTMGAGGVLPPDETNVVGPFECKSSEDGDGMRCENLNNGHGFELSTATFDLF